jgi:hypothetical protein
LSTAGSCRAARNRTARTAGPVARAFSRSRIIQRSTRARLRSDHHLVRLLLLLLLLLLRQRHRRDAFFLVSCRPQEHRNANNSPRRQEGRKQPRNAVGLRFVDRLEDATSRLPPFAFGRGRPSPGPASPWRLRPRRAPPTGQDRPRTLCLRLTCCPCPRCFPTTTSSLSPSSSTGRCAYVSSAATRETISSAKGPRFRG